MSYYRLHLFFCTNQKVPGKTCCQDKQATAFWEYAREKVKSLGIYDVRVNKSGCLGKCSLGPSLVIYPDNIWYSYSTKEDLDEIIHAHVVEGRPVERLLMSKKQTN